MFYRLVAAFLIMMVLAAGPASAERPVPDMLNSPITQSFITEVSVTGILLVDTSQVVLDRSLNGNVKSFAAKVIEAQAKIDAALKAALTQDQKQYLGTSLKTRRGMGAASLMRAKPEMLDKSYLRLQADTLEDEILSYRRYAKQGDDDKLKAFAAEMLPVLEELRASIEGMNAVRK